MPPSLRDRKRERTRLAILEAATRLFAERGYEATTVAEIATAADIGTRTFFGYFASKEELVLPGGAERIAAALAAIDARGPADRPMDVLLRALDAVIDGGHDFAGPDAALRLRIISEVPAVRGRALQVQQDAQREIARHLQAAYPDELDAMSAAAVVGAFVGAVTGAAEASAGDREGLRRAVERVLRPGPAR